MNSTFGTQLFGCSKKFCTIVNPYFLGCLFLIIFLNASAASVAYFVFNGSTPKHIDKQSTTTRRYFILRLYFANLSTCAKSRDQISLLSFTKTLCLGNFNRIKRYFVKDGFVSKQDWTLPIGSLL